MYRYDPSNLYGVWGRVVCILVLHGLHGRILTILRAFNTRLEGLGQEV